MTSSDPRDSTGPGDRRLGGGTPGASSPPDRDSPAEREAQDSDARTTTFPRHIWIVIAALLLGFGLMLTLYLVVAAQT
jgi:hypothetical protein